LEGVKRVAYETHGMANNIERDLNDQNIRSKATRANLRTMDGLIGESDSILTRMLRRERIHKSILIIVAILLVLGVIAILYFKVIK